MDQTPSKIVLTDSIGSFLALGFGSGLSKFAPGTFGTLVAVPVVWGLLYLPDFIYLALIIIGFIVGIKICERVSLKLGEEDPSAIVWDEIIGFGFAMSFARHEITVFIAGFLLFRFFDIVKPWPIKMVERKYSGGLGTMLDDAIAGLFTLFILQILAIYVF